MSRATGNPRAELTAWGLENLRLTTFHQPFGKVDGWWERMTGQEPDSSVGMKTGERAEIGQWEGLMLALQMNPQMGRIDWFVSELPGERENPPPLLTVGLAAFAGLITRWLASELPPQPVNRMALGAVVTLPVTNGEEGYRRLSDYLPFDIDRATSSDFSYQLNRKRDSTTLPGTQVNRLMKWSVGTFLQQTIRLTSSGVVGFGEPTNERTACRLDLDINTHQQEGQTLPQEQLRALFAELVSLAEEIIREGDIP